MVNGRELRFYESRAVPSPGAQADGDSINGNFDFTGEGQTLDQVRNVRTGATTIWYVPKATQQRVTPMRNARSIVALGLAAPGPRRMQQGQQPDAKIRHIAIDEGIPDNQMVAGNADIETLPADESSTTPSNQLQNGFDNPDVNDVSTSNSQ